MRDGFVINQQISAQGEAASLEPWMLSAILGTVEDACFVLDRDWRLLFVNEDGLKQLNVPPEEIPHRPLWEMLPVLVGTEIESCFRRAMADRLPVSLEAIWPVTRRWKNFRIYPAGEGVISLLVDVDDRVQAEALARQYKADLEAVQKAARIGRWHWDAATDEFRVSAELEQIFGPEPILDWAHRRGGVYSSKASLQLADGFDQAVRTGIGYDWEMPVWRADGTAIWVRAQCAVMRDPVRGIVAVGGTIQDITEQKQTEMALRDRAAELAALMDAIPAPVFVAHDPGCVQFTGNRAAGKMLRLGPELSFSLNGPKAEKLRHIRLTRDGRPLPVEELTAQYAGRGLPASGFDFGIEFDDGSVMEVLAYGTPLFDEAGRPRGGVMALLDVTELKKAQKGLTTRKLELSSFVGLSSEKMAMLDRDFNHLIASQLWYEMFGAGRAELNGVNLRELFPRLPPLLLDACTRALRGVPVLLDDDALVEVGGQKRWFSWIVSSWLDIHGEIGGVILVARDVTKWKQAEADLRRSEARLRLVLEASEIGVFEVDLTTGAIKWNAIEYRLFGVDYGDPIPLFDELFNKVHPDDVGRLREAWAEAERSGELEAEFRIRLPGGSERWLGARGGYIFDNEPAGVHFIGINFDITKSKRIEQALEEDRLQMAIVVASALEAIVSVDAQDRIILFNPAAERMFRCSATQALQAKLGSLFPVRLQEAYAHILQSDFSPKAADRKSTGQGDGTAVRADGEEFPVEFSFSKASIGEKTILTLMLRDVTDRVRLEGEVLTVGLREQARIGRELHDDICQQLVAAEFLASISALEVSKLAPGCEASLREVGERIRHALDSTQRLARGLADQTIGADGLAGAFRQLAANTERSFMISCRYQGPMEIELADRLVALHLYRIAQEAINNAIRHGKAGNIDLSVATDGPRVTLAIRDDGIGIPDPLPTGDGVGLGTMRYRASRIGGILKIRRRPEGGTEVLCTV